MFEEYVTIFGRQWQVYTIALLCATALGLLWMLLRAPQGKRGATIDALLALLFGGIIAGRLLHVLLHWNFFADRPDLIGNLLAEGGLSWHGVVIGGVFAALLILRWRGMDVRRFLDDLAVVLAALVFAAWRGCAASGCAYGTPVPTLADYPAWLVWIERDIYRLAEPRFAVQQIGMWLAILLLLLALLLTVRGWLRGRRFWVLLALLAAGMFALGFLRSDDLPRWYALRADQWLDAGMLLFALLLALRTANDRRYITESALLQNDIFS